MPTAKDVGRGDQSGRTKEEREGMKGTLIAIVSVALLAGCATDRGGMSEDAYREVGPSERPGDYLRSADPTPGATEGINNAPVQPRAPGGFGPTEPR